MPYLGVQPTPYGSPESFEDIFPIPDGYVGIQTTFTMNRDVTSESDIIVWINGVAQTQGAYELSGVGRRIITLPEGLVQNDELRVLHLGFKAISINTGAPDDDSVTAQKLTINAVETSKINADAITADKIADGAVELSHLDPSIELGGPSLGNFSMIRTNPKELTENLVFTGNENGMSIGPITLAGAVSVTVTDGSTWTII